MEPYDRVKLEWRDYRRGHHAHRDPRAPGTDVATVLDELLERARAPYERIGRRLLMTDILLLIAISQEVELQDLHAALAEQKRASAP